jgi:hypothetical protein
MLDLISSRHLLLVRSQALIHIINLPNLAGQQLTVIQLRSVQHLQQHTAAQYVHHASFTNNYIGASSQVRLLDMCKLVHALASMLPVQYPPYS